MIALHETPGADIALSAYFAGLQEPETRIDIVRHAWLDQNTDTQRLLDALAVDRVHELRSGR
jgi:hypothetical protein